MKHTKKILALVLSVAVVASIAAAGTLAWLTNTTDTVTNTFKTNDVGVAAELKEHLVVKDPETGKETLGADEVTENNYDGMVPGKTFPKDPFVKVKTGSETCYVFVKVDDQIAATVENATIIDWNKGEGATQWTEVAENIYVYNSPVAADGKTEPLFNSVTINGEVVNENNLQSLNNKTIVLDGYAHQAYGAENASLLEVATEQAIKVLTGAVTEPAA